MADKKKLLDKYWRELADPNISHSRFEELLIRIKQLKKSL